MASKPAAPHTPDGSKGLRGRLRAAKEAANLQAEEKKQNVSGKRRPPAEEEEEEDAGGRKRACSDAKKAEVAKGDSSNALRDKRRRLASADYAEDAEDGTNNDAAATCDYSEEADFEDASKRGRDRDQSPRAAAAAAKKRSPRAAAAGKPAEDASAMPGKKTLVSTLKFLGV